MKFYSDKMNLNIKDAVGYLTFKELEKYSFINHAFSTRLGGVSKGAYKSMNLRFNCDDKRENVLENYKIFCNAAGFDYNSLVLTDQTHTCNIRKVTKQDMGIGLIKPQNKFDIDGLITNEAGVTLVTFHADCVPIFIIDKVKRVIALLHSGRKGTVNGIATNAINIMKSEYGCNAEDIVCGIGPSINKCCYEVSEDVFNQFTDIPNINVEDIYCVGENGKYYLDLNNTNKLILKSEGIKEENIFISDLCTRCNHDLLISHRKTGGIRGVMVAMMCIKC